MNGNDNERDINNPGADSAETESVASAAEATGLMAAPPRSGAEEKAERELHSLQAPGRWRMHFPGGRDVETGEIFPAGPDEILPGYIPPFGWPDRNRHRIFGADDNRSSRKPLTAWDVTNGEGAKS